MGLINHSIPNLINGVSQQPETLRLGSQGEVQENGLSSVVEGLRKRPPTDFIKRITTATYTNPFIHTINRDVNERYVVIITQNDIKVYDIDGVQKTVVDGGSSGTFNGYLNESNPKDNFEAVTVADFTFIVNKNKTVAKSNTVSTARPFEAIYSVTQGVTNTQYELKINGTTYTYTTDSSSANFQTQNIATQIFNQISGLSGFTVTNLGSDLHISNSSDFTISAVDGFGNQASQVIKDKTTKFSNLPPKAVNGMIVEISGDTDNQFDNYYVVFESDGNADEGVWRETVKSGLKNSLDVSTMPHLLIRTADGNFRFAPADGSTYTVSGTQFDVQEYGPRVAGDLESAPDPSFVGRKINDIFFFRNRLGFISDEEVNMSRAGEFFKFYPETVTTILDTDPIDLSVSHTKVSILRHAIPYNEELLLFSDQSQFILKGGNTLTPSNVNVNVTTEYEASLTTKPVGSGRSVFFTFSKGNFTGVREFFTNIDGEVNEADDITGAIPKYIPKNVFKMAIATNENILAVLSSEDQHKLYIYQWYESNNQKVQQAWHKWIYGGSANTTVLNMDFIETTLFLLVQRTDGVHLLSIDTSPNPTDTGATYLTHLDMKVNESTSGLTKSFNSGNNQTTITLPYTKYNDMQVVTRNVSGSTTIAGQIIPIVSSSTNQLVVSGDHTATKFFIGEKYGFKYQFSQQYVRLSGGGSRTAIKEGRLQIRNWTVSFDNTGFFKVNITPKGRSTTTETFTGAIVGSGTVNGIQLEDGDFNFAVQSRNEDLVITLTNDEYLPSAFINAEWQGYFTQRSQQNT